MRSLSWRLTLRAIAVLSWIVSIIWLIVEPAFEPLLAFLGGTAAFLGSFAVSDAPISDALKYSPTPEQRDRNRRAMLELVKNTWVKGVLENSLHGAVLIELGMKERIDAVERPWDMVLQAVGQPNRTLPRGTKIIDVFDEMNAALLILGEPGSGKTTMLLELARDLITCAERDDEQPIPIVFNLSSWAEKQQPIADWLADELNAKYHIPKRIAGHWVENDELTVLLDGLDEVRLERRDACAQAINEFRQEHLVSLAVCSRVADYEALTTRLRLQGAICLQPLTPQQIDEYLAGAGVELLAVRKTLEHDTTFQELAETPLMLSVMTLAYRGMSVQDLDSLETTETRRKHVFDTYAQRMFELCGSDDHYSPEKTAHWLSWLARKMMEHKQTVFLIERLQPDWLQTGTQQRVYIMIVGLIVLAIYGLIEGLCVTIAGGSFERGLIAGLIVGAIVGLISGLSERDIRSVELLRWSWKASIRMLILLVSVFVMLALYEKLRDRAMNVSFPSAWYGMLLLTFVIGFAGLIRAQTEEAGIRAAPNQGIRQSAKYAVVTGLSAAVLVGVSIGFGLNEGMIRALRALLVFGPIVGLSFGMAFGGYACIQHFTLRLILCRNGYIPWNYARFLDYAADRIFLRKVGGGYIFIHRLLMEYFAELEPG